MTTSTSVPLLVLDIDGTVRQGRDDDLGRYVNGPGDVRVFPEAVERMKEWNHSGGRIVGASNQGGIALGHVSFEQVAEAMRETHRQADRLFDLMAWCQHHPHAADPEMARCWCRKPRTGLVTETASQLARQLRDRGISERYPPHLGLFVGDRPEDQACAEALNMRFQWAADWRAEA